MILLRSRERGHWKELTEEGFYPVGVGGTVTDVSKNGYCIVETSDRVSLDAINGKGAFHAELSISGFRTRRRWIPKLNSLE